MALGDVKPDPKPEGSPGGVGRPKAKRRTDASPRRIAEIKAKKARFCVLCGTDQRVNAHHLIPRSLGGLWTESNIVGLCGSGTTGCHGLVEAREPVACVALRWVLTDAEYSYVVEKKGEGFLDRYYPVRYENAAAEPGRNARNATAGRQRPGAAA